MTWSLKLSKLMLGILGEAFDVKGHEGADVGVVGVSRKSSLEGGPDLAGFLDDEENSRVRLFFFLIGFPTDSLSPGAANGYSGPPPPKFIILSVSRSIDVVHEPSDEEQLLRHT